MSTGNEDTTLTPLSAFDIWADGTARGAVDLGTRPADGAAYRWLHFDLSDLALPGWSTLNLPGLARRTLLADKTRPRMDMDEHGMAITLRGINLNAGEESADMVSLRIWLTADLVITVRRQRIFAMEDLRDQVMADNAPHSPGHMLARITEGLVERLEDIAFTREDTADDMEDEVYDHDRAPIDDLAPLRREIIKFRRHVAPLAEALTQVSQAETDLIKEDLRHRLRDTASRCRWALEELSEVHDRLTAMADHLDAVQNARLERNGYRLSIVAAIFLPLGFLTGLFGVNVGGMPGIDHPHAFWWLCAAMAAIGLVSAAIMRWLRWF